MGRPKKPAPSSVEPEFESQEIFEDEPDATEEPEASPQKAVSQSVAARAAIDAGYEKPVQAVEYIKKTYGIDMNPQYFSAIKSRTKASHEPAPSAKSGPAGGGPKPKAASMEGFLAPPETPKAPGEPDLLLALEGVKQLVSQFGAEKVRRMVDLIG